VPTVHPRIQVTNDPELAEALARVARFYAGKPASQVVRDLAIKGAEAVEREQGERAAAIDRLSASCTTTRTSTRSRPCSASRAAGSAG
jgi:hypothetical protein